MSPTSLQTNRRAYQWLFVYCLLSAARDALWGKYLQIGTPLISAGYSLLSGCLVTLAISAAFGLYRRKLSFTKFRKFTYPGGWSNFFIINLATAGAYYAYLLAVASPIGPGLSCFVDYALNPVTTMAMAVLVLGVKWRRALSVSLGLAMAGLFFFFVPRLSGQPSTNWGFIAGIGFALTSAFLGGVFKVYSKKALQLGLGKIEVLFLRLGVLTLVLIAHVASSPMPITATQAVYLLAWGTFGFFLPLILFLRILQLLPMESIVLISFSVPVLTYGFSAVLGLQRILIFDLPAAFLIFYAVYYHETKRRSEIAEAPATLG